MRYYITKQRVKDKMPLLDTGIDFSVNAGLGSGSIS